MKIKFKIQGGSECCGIHRGVFSIVAYKDESRTILLDYVYYNLPYRASFKLLAKYNELLNKMIKSKMELENSLAWKKYEQDNKEYETFLNNI